MIYGHCINQRQTTTTITYLLPATAQGTIAPPPSSCERPFEVGFYALCVGHVAPIAVSVVELMNRLLATLMDFSSSSHTTLAALCVPYIVCIITKPHEYLLFHRWNHRPWEPRPPASTFRRYGDQLWYEILYELNKIIFAVQTPGIFNKSSKYYSFILYFNW